MSSSSRDEPKILAGRCEKLAGSGVRPRGLKPVLARDLRGAEAPLFHGGFRQQSRVTAEASHAGGESQFGRRSRSGGGGGRGWQGVLVFAQALLHEDDIVQS